MAKYLYVAPDLARTGIVETDLLEATTERHIVTLPIPFLQTLNMPLEDEAVRIAAVGVIFQPPTGLPGRRHRQLALELLRRGMRVWMHWPSEHAVERVDAERVRSFRRHAVAQSM